LTNQPRRLCCVCFAGPATQGRHCDACSVARNRPHRPQPARPLVDLSQGIPEDLSGYTLANFGIVDDT